MITHIRPQNKASFIPFEAKAEFLHEHRQLQLFTVTTVDQDLENLQNQRFIFALIYWGVKMQSLENKLWHREIMKQFQCG